MNTNNREIEVRRFEIDEPKLEARLKELGAEDLGKDLLKEIIFYDQAGKWRLYCTKLEPIFKTNDVARFARLNWSGKNLKV